MPEKKKKDKLSDIEEDVYDVERIVDRRFYNQRTEYLVKWLGYPEEDNSWEPVENILERSLIENFEKEDFDKSKKSKLNEKSSSTKYIGHSSKKRKIIEDSSEEEEEERREYIPTSSSGHRSSTKSHKDKDRHHHKHKHRSDHHHRNEKHRHKLSSKLLKGSSDISSILDKKKKKKHKKRKHHEHDGDNDDILTDTSTEHVQTDDKPAKKAIKSQGTSLEQFFENIKGKPKLCTPVTCNGTTFTITEYLV